MANINLGTLLLKLAADSKQWKKGFKEAGDASDEFGKGMGDLKSLAKTALAGGVAAAAAAATAAIVKFSQESLEEFKQFEQGMSEVYTLLPGISEKAMGEMEADVLKFSQEVGRTSDEVIPALYQSLSAGVPQGDVFSFMKIASDAALGGVTSLETAVDGLTSVVNAYGSEVVNAQQASDVMFTAVRLGKTDFEQLSKSLFNVIPTAASLGVEFSDVASELAALTAQGTPTSVATTQLRQAFVEASKSGTKLSVAIEKLTGKSFAQLMADGRTSSSVFMELRESMPETEFRDLFGSVEAMNAVLGVTSETAQGVIADFGDMGDTIGATAAAADTMAQSMTYLEGQVEASSEAAKIQAGQALSPLKRSWLELRLGVNKYFAQDLAKRNQIDATTAALEEQGKTTYEARQIIMGMAETNVMWRDTMADAETMARRTDIAVKLLGDGFQGTSDELITAVLALDNMNDSTANYVESVVLAKAASSAYSTTLSELNQATDDATQATFDYTWNLDDTGEKLEYLYLVSQDYTEAAEEQAVTAAELSAIEEQRKEALEAETLAQEEAKQSLIEYNATLGGYFNSALTAAEQTTSLEMQLYNSAAAAGVGADQLVILAAATGEFSQEEIEAAFQAALMQANIDALVGAMQDGSITADEATDALRRLQDGEVDTAADAIALAQRAGAVQSELDGVSGAAIDAAGSLDRIPREINVRVKVQADPVPTYRSSDPNSPGGGATVYAEGGFTGGREGEIVGAVHGQEFVFSPPAVRSIGLDSLRLLHDLARGGGMGSVNNSFNLNVTELVNGGVQGEYAVMQAMLGGT